MSALSQSRSTSNITRMRQVFEGGQGMPVPLSRCQSEVITTRGFKPSDIRDPVKTRILEDLTYRIWGRNMEGAGDLQNGVAKPVDLQKLFTPAEDAPQILPKKKMFANSSFYGPNHPTVEEQVELARRISSSLSDISNKESKGQSMYVNRKKRAVKWVHAEDQQNYSSTEFSEISHPSENLPPTPKATEKPLLTLVMNPHGKVQDFSSLRGPAIDATPSPEVCFDLVKDLNSPCGKGAEMFAKRRKKAEKWVVEESNMKSSSEMTSMSSYESSYSSQISQQMSSQSTTSQQSRMLTPTLPPNITSLPPLTYMKDVPQRFAPTAAKNQIPDKYTQPKVKLIKSPWEAALQGDLDGAFQEAAVPAPLSPTPRGNIQIAPLPSSLSKLATPPPMQSYPPPSDIYLAKPPRAWHPQPTGKQFSSVKLDHIFAGSAKSPVSLAYHADTNTMSSEPVHVENIPQIAAKLQDYEVIDQSILKEQQTRRIDQVLADVESVAESVDQISEQQNDASSSIMWTATSSNWSTPQQEVKWPPQPSRSPALIKPAVFIPTSPQPTTWKPPQPIQQSLQTSLQESLTEIQNVMSQTCQNFSKTESSEIMKTESVSQEEIAISQESCLIKEGSNEIESTSSIVIAEEVKSDSMTSEEVIIAESTQVSKFDEITSNKIQDMAQSINIGTSHIDSSAECRKQVEELNIQQNSGVTEALETGAQYKESLDLSKIQKDSSTLMQSITDSQKFITDSVQEETIEKTASSGISSLQGILNESSKTLIENTKEGQSSQISSDICFEKYGSLSSSEQQMSMQSQSSTSQSFYEQKQESVTSSNMTSNFYGAQAMDEMKSLNYSSKGGYSSFNESQNFSSFGNVEKSEFKSMQQESHAASNRLSLSVMSTTDEEVQDLCEREFNQFSMQYEKVDKPDIKKPAAIVPSGAVKIFPTPDAFNPVQKFEQKPWEQSNQNGYQENAVKEPIKKPYKKPPSMVPGAKPLFGEAIELHLGPEGDRPYEQIPVKNLIKSFEDSTRPFMKSRSQEPLIDMAREQQMYQGSSFQQQNSYQQSSQTQSTYSSSQQSMYQQSSLQQHNVYQQSSLQQENAYQQSLEQQNGYLQSSNQQNGYQQSSLLDQTLNQQSSIQHLTEQSSLQQQSMSEQSAAYRTSLYNTFPSDDIPSFQGDIKSQAPVVNKERSGVQASQPIPKPTPPAASNIYVDVSNVNNFNTAPRGWKTNMSYYRPVTFQSEPSVQYSDF